jgi:Zn-dependent peptidase ImmA (M78 family)
MIPVSPERAANKLTQILDARDGLDRFDRGPVNPEKLAREYSAERFPTEPIIYVSGKRLDGCSGALLFGETKPRQWGILYDDRQDSRRRNFTIAHEFGHYLLHRDMIEKTKPGGLYCSEADIEQGEGSTGIEREADAFAATLLMPLHDFRKQMGPKSRASFATLGHMADRYDVSLTAVILRWLQYTETRALVVVSNEGYALWAKSSTSARSSGMLIRTRNVMYELPDEAVAKMRSTSSPAVCSISQPSGVWFDEPVIETSLRASRLDQEITLLQFDTKGYELEEEITPDLVDRLGDFHSRTN